MILDLQQRIIMLQGLFNANRYERGPNAPWAPDLAVALAARNSVINFIGEGHTKRLRLRAYIMRELEAEHMEPCRHGHLGCAQRDGGNCSDEAFGAAVQYGFVDEDGNEL